MTSSCFNHPFLTVSIFVASNSLCRSTFLISFNGCTLISQPVTVYYRQSAYHRAKTTPHRVIDAALLVIKWAACDKQPSLDCLAKQFVTSHQFARLCPLTKTRAVRLLLPKPQSACSGRNLFEIAECPPQWRPWSVNALLKIIQTLCKWH